MVQRPTRFRYRTPSNSCSSVSVIGVVGVSHRYRWCIIDVVGVCHRCRRGVSSISLVYHRCRRCVSLMLSVCAMGVVGVSHRCRRRFCRCLHCYWCCRHRCLLRTRVVVCRFWEMLAYLANTLIFILVGMMITTQAIHGVSDSDWVLTIALYCAVTVIR